MDDEITDCIYSPVRCESLSLAIWFYIYFISKRVKLATIFFYENA
jgi:hypothetical protein